MKQRILVLGLLAGLLSTSLSAQTGFPEDRLTRNEVSAHMFFLASDELAGRRTGSPGIQIAANYLASHYANLGLQPAPGMDGYFQAVPYEETTPPEAGSIEMFGQTYQQGEDVLFLASPALSNLDAKFVFANYGLKNDTINDYEGLNVKGKVVVTYLGLPGEENPGAIFGAVRDKRKWAKEEGAIGMIELYRIRFPWGFALRYFKGSRISLAEEEGNSTSDFFYGWLRDDKGETGEQVVQKKKGTMTVSCPGGLDRRFSSPNVIGYLPGTDSSLRNEFIIISAHYDHVGTGKQGGGSYTKDDSIFNGARDNAFGTVAVLATAKALAANPPRRPVLFICYSGEEVGLLGSSYYADNPVVPLRQTVFNLNCDGAGYNDTGAISIIGYGRIDTDAQLDATAAAFGLRIIANPSPEQNLFDRSDNVSLAEKGVPAPTFSPGVTGFNQAINKYYHQVADNPETIDLDYLRVFCQAFAHSARLIANRDTAPVWVEDDKYAPAARELYGN